MLGFVHCMLCKEQTFPFFSFATESHDVISIIENNLLRLLFNWVYTILFQISCYLPLHFTVNAAVCTALANKKIKCNSFMLQPSIAIVMIPAGSWLCCWEWASFSPASVRRVSPCSQQCALSQIP